MTECDYVIMSKVNMIVLIWSHLDKYTPLTSAGAYLELNKFYIHYTM